MERTIKNLNEILGPGLNPHDLSFGQLLPEDVAILVSAGKLRPLSRPNPNAVKFFSAVELITLLADREWLDEATKTIGQFWKRKHARRNGVTLEKQTADVPG